MRQPIDELRHHLDDLKAWAQSVHTENRDDVRRIGEIARKIEARTAMLQSTERQIAAMQKIYDLLSGGCNGK